MSDNESITPPAAPELRGQRSRPWTPAEFIMVNNRALVYEVNALTREVIIKLPGRAQTSPAALRRAGHAVVMPAQWRDSNFN